MGFKKQKKQKEKGRKEKIVESLELSKELLLGDCVVTLTGKSEAYIENYRGIIEYTSERIKLQAKKCVIEFEGSGLKVGYYTNDGMKITGQISDIHYK